MLRNHGLGGNLVELENQRIDENDHDNGPEYCVDPGKYFSPESFEELHGHQFALCSLFLHLDQAEAFEIFLVVDRMKKRDVEAVSDDAQCVKHVVRRQLDTAAAPGENQVHRVEEKLKDGEIGQGLLDHHEFPPFQFPPLPCSGEGQVKQPADEAQGCQRKQDGNHRSREKT
jgi:hypothetical protein